MSVKKVFAGTKLKEVRQRVSLTQKEFAQKLGVSLPYLNQMENNNRPVSGAVVLALAQEFGFDVTELSSADNERILSDLREAVADPIFTDTEPPVSDLRLAATNAPMFARAFLELHRAYRQTQERLATLDEALGNSSANLQASPWEEVRDFFHYCDNYIDAVDRAAEQFAKGRKGPNWVRDKALKKLEDIGVRVQFIQTHKVREYDPKSQNLYLSAHSPETSQTFQILLQLALMTQDTLFEATLDFARFQTHQARDIAKIGLANYFAGAALMPYQEFLSTARAERHDLERMTRIFGVSLEQVAHRLSTMQRPDAKGIPFFFVRIDQSGTITKRHSATRLQFARFGGACPLWNVHQAFETPGRFLRQLAETPDGVRYISLACEVSKPSGSYGAPVPRFAIALGCEIHHADQLVYTDTMDLTTPDAYEPIGVSCRLCERRDCHQRSVPPLERQLSVDPFNRDRLPYSVN